ncbi:hypothetical protein FAIPA1_480011 [Frankia sp. AiPs1]
MTVASGSTCPSRRATASPRIPPPITAMRRATPAPFDPSSRLPPNPAAPPRRRYRTVSRRRADGGPGQTVVPGGGWSRAEGGPGGVWSRADGTSGRTGADVLPERYAAQSAAEQDPATQVVVGGKSDTNPPTATCLDLAPPRRRFRRHAR